MLVHKVSTECIHASCDLSTYGDGLVEFMPGRICHVKDPNVETIFSDCKHQLRGRVLGILQDRANVVIILCTHWQMSSSK